MLIQTNRELTCPERTRNELYYYEPNDALNSYNLLFQSVDSSSTGHGWCWSFHNGMIENIVYDLFKRSGVTLPR